MMCNCINKIEEQVKTKHDAARSCFMRPGWAEVSYTPYRKDGQVARHNRSEGIDWKYCPFCGIPIETGGKK